jgi:hypothetical protein
MGVLHELRDRFLDRYKNIFYTQKKIVMGVLSEWRDRLKTAPGFARPAEPLQAKQRLAGGSVDMKNFKSAYPKLPARFLNIRGGVLYRCNVTGNREYAVRIPDGVKEIRGIQESGRRFITGAFEGCMGLREVYIPDSVTAIGEAAFLNCIGLTQINIPNSVTYIGEQAFRNCRGLTQITIPDGVTFIGPAAFLSCSGLTQITIPDGLYIGGIFGGCSGLTQITIPDSVTALGERAFANCNNLQKVHIPDTVREIGENAFSAYDNASNTYVWLPNLSEDTKKKLTDLGYPGPTNE